MLNEILLSTNVGTVLPASLVIFLTFFMLRKNKNHKKLIDVNQNDRIYCYNPQQLIDFTKINPNEALEIPAPDEISSSL